MFPESQRIVEYDTDYMDEAEELAEQLNSLDGTDEVDVGPAGVSAWVPMDRVEDARELASEAGFSEGPSYATDDGSEMFMPFDFPDA